MLAVLLNNSDIAKSNWRLFIERGFKGTLPGRTMTAESDDTLRPLLSGACAGLAVDLSLFPLDTLKTRLQAQGGFFVNGGWTGVYRGMGSIAVGSAPSGID